MLLDYNIIQLLESQLQRIPRKLALISGSQEVSYQELNQQINIIVQKLEFLRIPTGSRICVYLSNTKYFIASILAIVKMGCVFVPLDVESPVTRNQLIILDSQANLIITQKKLAKDFEDSRQKILTVDQDDNVVPLKGASSKLETDELACLYYVSSAIGPKGIPLTHKSLTNYFNWVQQTLPFSNKDRFINLQPTFSALALTEIITPLMLGATLVLAQNNIIEDHESFIAAINNYKVTVIQTNPNELLNLLMEEQLSKCPTLKHVLVSAGPISPELQDLFFNQTNANLYYLYGETETTIHSTCYRADRNKAISRTFLPGQPISNTQVYLLDEHLNPVTNNDEIGELYIGGAGVSPGYWQYPREKDEYFIQNPFQTDTSNRLLFRTGYLGRYDNGGNIVDVRRNDSQSNIKGVRVELVEIENNIKKCSDVSDAFVMLRKDSDGEEQIVAYVIPNLINIRIPFESSVQLDIGDVSFTVSTEDISINGICLKDLRKNFTGNMVTVHLKFPDNQLSVDGQIIWHNPPRTGIEFKCTQIQKEILQDELNKLRMLADGTLLLCPTVLAHRNLRYALAKNLPKYMIHSASIWIDKFPRNEKGAINTSLLPEPNYALKTKKYIAPRNMMEQNVANIFSEIFNIKIINVDDNIFEMGVDSVRATQMLSRINRLYNLRIHLDEVFNNPTVALITQVIIYHMSQQEDTPFRSVQHNKLMNLSFAERRLWFLEKTNPSSGAHNLTYAFKLMGRINIRVLKKSLATLAARHEAFRTIYLEEDGIPYRKVLPKVKVNLNIVKEVNHTKLNLDECLHEEAIKPFKLDTGPLIRFTLFDLDHNEHAKLLTLVAHSIVADEWSISLLLDDLSLIYNAAVAGESLPLSPLEFQYSDFAAWQTDYLSSNSIEDELNYWQKQLDNAPTLINLPKDKPRQSVMNYSSVIEHFGISAILSRKIKQLAKQENVTLYMVLLASFLVLLHRYTGETDILVGTQIANRNREEVEQIVGSFSNSLVMRGNLEGNPSFKEFLKNVKEITLAAYDHSIIPFEMLLDHLAIEHTLSYSPLFQVKFDLKAPTVNKLDFFDLVTKPEFINQTQSQLDLGFAITERPEYLSAEITFNTSLYKPKTIRSLYQHWLNILTSIIENPKQSIGSLGLLSEQDRQYLLKDRNDTEATYPYEALIFQLIEDQVTRTPNEIAVEYHHEKLTYEELNQRANQLAHYLRTLNVSPETKIAVYVERDINLVSILLGILKSGAAYVPIDIKYPKDRVDFILEDSETQILITQRSVAEFSFTIPHIIYIDEAWDTIKQQATTNPSCNVNSKNLAYIIYTSGSTGKPKGVMLYHRNTVNFLSWCKSFCSVDEVLRVLGSTSITFDLSIFELFFPLTIGGTTIIAANLLEIQDWIDKDVTFIFAVPSVMQSLLALGLIIPKTVQSIYFGGESLPNTLAQTLYAIPTVKKICNVYAPTETTTFSVISIVKKSSSESINLGFPIANTQFYILDPYMNPVPNGCIGELYIGGDGVSRGYLNRMSLTKERYLDNPFASKKQIQHDVTKMYKTGDLVSYMPNGALKYIGRVDFQIKIHGYRVELGEIENALSKYPSVKEGVVIVREDTPGDKRLAAYVTPADNKLTIGKLRNFIKSHLPSYMVPSDFVVLDQFPLNSNGKIDRNKLPVPEKQSAEDRHHAEPKTATEIRLVSIWKNLLKGADIGIDDNFFDLGGHSLLITQLAYQLKREFDYNLSFVQFINKPVISALADYIDTKTTYVDPSATLKMMDKDLAMAREILPAKGEITSTSEPGAIFLTGVTGFLGIHILDELIQKTNSKVYCLARQSKGKSIADIFAAHATRFQLQHLIDNPRIVFIEGELTETKLGIKPSDWRELAENVDSIYHVAAYVHHIYDYKTLRKANVEGTIELMKLASEVKPKHIHYVSTLWAIFDKDEHNTMLEQLPQQKPTGLEDGYALTKWTAEKILSEAKERGFSVTVHRPGFILGHSRTGAISIQNIHILLLIKGCLQMGYAPKGLGYLDALPVDFVARSLLQITLNKNNLGKAYNYSHPKRPLLEQVFEWLRNTGFAIELIPYKEWRDQYLANITEQNAMYPIASIYLNSDSHDLSARSIAADNFLHALKADNLQVPELNAFLFATYFSYLEKWLLAE